MENKLIEKLENIILEETRAGDGPCVYYTEEAAIKCVEECKKVAIAFGSYCIDLTCDLARYLPLEKIFENFLKEEYGKISR
jgi:hypothetical protein